MSALLEVRGLEVGIDGLPILRGVDMEVKPGEILGVVGETGAGKSMTARSVLDLLPAKATVSFASCTFAGQDFIPPQGAPGGPRPPDRLRAPAAPRQSQPGVPGRPTSCPPPSAASGTWAGGRQRARP